MFRDCRAEPSHALGHPRRHTPLTQWQLDSSGALHENYYVRGEAELKEGGAGPGTDWTCESLRTRNQQCQRRSYSVDQRFTWACGPLQGLRRGSWLGLTVIFDVSLRGFRCVVRCVMVMTVRQLSVVRGGLVFARFVVSGRFFVVSCRMFVMFCRFMMMLSCLL